MRLDLEQTILKELLKGGSLNSLDRVDVIQFHQLLRRHKLISVGKQILDILPSAKKDYLQEKIFDWTCRSLILMHETISIIEIFQKASISYLLLKGPILSLQLFGNISERFYTDIDILINYSDLITSKKILESNQYQLINPKYILTNDSLKKHARIKNDLRFYNKEKGVFLELHFGIYDGKLLSRKHEGIITNFKSETVFQGNSISVLNAEENFIYTCYHGAKHSFFRLTWIRDIAFFLEKEDLDHTLVKSKIKKLGFERVFGISLLLARKYFNAQIPEVYSEYLTGKALKTLIKLSERIIWGSDTIRIFSILSNKRLYFKSSYELRNMIITWFYRYVFGFLLKTGINYKILRLRAIFKEKKRKFY